MRPSRKNILFAFLITLIVGASPHVWAASRWYEVEVIIFRNTDTDAVGGEYWPALESLPDFRNAIELFVDLPEFADEPSISHPNAVASPAPLAFQSLRPGELQLSSIFRRLEKLSAYDPILHVGWRQPGFVGSRARSVYLSDKPLIGVDTRDPSETVSAPAAIAWRIEGTVRIRAGRLLHIDADFVSYGDESPVRITEQRQVILNELHYFDHPLFGVIVRVTPYHIPDLPDPSSNASNIGLVGD